LSFSNTVEESCLKIAGQYVVCHGATTVVQAHDIKRNYDISKKFMEILVNRIDVKDDKETQDEIKKVIDVFKRSIQLRRRDYLTKNEFKAALNRLLHRGMNTCGNLIDSYAEAGYFEIKKGDKNSYNYFLKED
jgi:hypothetical protein